MFKEFDIFDLVGALCSWLEHNWQGQSDPMYSMYCNLTGPGGYKRGRFQDKLTANEKLVYDFLTWDNYEQAYETIMEYLGKGE